MKPLKILLGNNTLSLLAGSETWIKTLALQLKEMGHSVKGFSPNLGIISKELQDKGIPCYPNISISGVQPFSYRFEEKVKHEYDVIIASHYEIVESLRVIFPKTPIISTIHGIMHTMDDGAGNKMKAPEHPAEAGVNQFVAVSEEVQAFLKEKYNIEAIVIKNFIDLNTFKSKRKASVKKPRSILLNSNYALPKDPDVAVLKNVAKHYGANLVAAGEHFSLFPNMIEAIENSDIVIGMGRSVLEGVAAGRLGIVHGRWGTGGVIHEGNIKELAMVNFSGRNPGGAYYTEEDFIREIDAHYNPENIEWGINYIKREHNVVHAANEIIGIARSLLGEDINARDEVRTIPYRRQKDVEQKPEN